MLTLDCIYAPVSGFLRYLLAGWTFPDDIAEPMPSHHGHYSVLLIRQSKARRKRKTKGL